jgi:hypothetical protein
LKLEPPPKRYERPGIEGFLVAIPGLEPGFEP